VCVCVCVCVCVRDSDIVVHIHTQVLVSATLGEDVVRLANLTLREPVSLGFIHTHTHTHTHTHITHTHTHTNITTTDKTQPQPPSSSHTHTHTHAHTPYNNTIEFEDDIKGEKHTIPVTLKQLYVCAQAKHRLIILTALLRWNALSAQQKCVCVCVCVCMCVYVCVV